MTNEATRFEIWARQSEDEEWTFLCTYDSYDKACDDVDVMLQDYEDAGIAMACQIRPIR